MIRIGTLAILGACSSGPGTWEPSTQGTDYGRPERYQFEVEYSDGLSGAEPRVSGWWMVEQTGLRRLIDLSYVASDVTAEGCHSDFVFVEAIDLRTLVLPLNRNPVAIHGRTIDGLIGEPPDHGSRRTVGGMARAETTEHGWRVEVEDPDEVCTDLVCENIPLSTTIHLIGDLGGAMVQNP